ncbi:MAG: 6-bladed beta-propeller [Gemmatimonadota bacterium]
MGIDIRRTACGSGAWLALLGAFLWIGACDLVRPADPGVVITDSAGVRIVQNEAPAWTADKSWRLVEPPTVQIGAMDGEPAYLFDRIMGAVTLSDGRIVVADMGASELRFFDPDGQHLMSVGSRGEGPGEFRQVMGLHRLPDDGIAVYDLLERLHMYGSDGTYRDVIATGSMPLPSVDPITFQLNPPTGIRVVGWLEDGTFIGWEASRLAVTAERRFEQADTLTLTFSRFGRDGAVLNELVSLEGPAYHPHPMNLILPAVFGATTYAGTDGRSLIVGLSREGEVRWYHPEGRLERLTRRAWPGQAATEGMVDDYVRHSVPPLREDIARGRTFADTLPRFSRLVSDRAGNVWLRHFEVSHGATTTHHRPTYDGPSTWSVVDPDGRWLGEVTTPADFTVFEIGQDHVLGMYRDEFDVEYVRVYALEKE